MNTNPDVPPPEPPAGVDAEKLMRDLRARAFRLADLAEANLPPESEVRRVLATVFGSPLEDADPEDDPDEAVRRALAVFDGLSYVEKRLILNGWPPPGPGEPTDRAAAFRKLDAADVHRALRLDAWPDGRAVNARFRAMFTGVDAPALVLVREGTTRAQVLAALSSVGMAVASGWELVLGEAADPAAREDEDRRRHGRR